jgi:capsular polysaccharide export protein
MVMVNSTSATFALAGGVPVKALGTAVAIPGITDHGLLSDFWTNPTPPIRSFTTPSAACCTNAAWCAAGWPAGQPRILVENAVARLLAD